METAETETMDNEQSKIVKTMRNAIKNGNLDVVKELLKSNGGLLTVNTVLVNSPLLPHMVESILRVTLLTAE